jgi:hypothetical protein
MHAAAMYAMLLVKRLAPLMTHIDRPTGKPAMTTDERVNHRVKDSSGRSTVDMPAAVEATERAAFPFLLLLALLVIKCMFANYQTRSAAELVPGSCCAIG